RGRNRWCTRGWWQHARHCRCRPADRCSDRPRLPPPRHPHRAAFPAPRRRGCRWLRHRRGYHPARLKIAAERAAPWIRPALHPRDSVARQPTVMQPNASPEPNRAGYADVNGLHMYYEEYGAGSPLVLLHGGMLTIELNFAPLIPALSRRHRVIGVEMQGHGRTAHIDREITPAALASDVVGLLNLLGIDRAHVLGHSMGGAVTIELGIKYPDRVRSLVPASASVRPDGLHADLTDPARQATSSRMPTEQDFR